MMRLRDMAVWAGGAALLVATGADTLAVIGRRIGVPLQGSIELIQAAVLVAGSLAMVIATASDNHARVRRMIERLSRGREAADRASDLLTGIFFACLLAGSVWLAVDLWGSHEISEIVGVPWRWLRLFANLCLVTIVLITLRRVVRGHRP